MKQRRMSYLQYRSNALSSLTLKGVGKGMNAMSKDDLEKWVKRNYLKHYGRRK